MEKCLPVTDRDHTYLLTTDNILFCVAGNLHSREHIFGMPYYFLTQELEEILDITVNEHVIVAGRGFSKLLDQIPLSEYALFIKENYPDYYFSPSMWEVLMKVDRSRLRQVFDPRALVRKIRKEYPMTADEENSLLYTLYKIQTDGFGLISNVGITGSVLLSGTVDFPAKDIDLIFYKRDSIQAVTDFSAAVLQGDPRFTGLQGEVLRSYVEKKRERFRGADEQIAYLVANRWDILFVDGVKLDLDFCEETRPTIPDYDLLRRMERVRFNAKVIDISDSYFLPTRLKIEHDRFRDVIITTRGYVSLFNLGDTIRVDGLVYTPEGNNHEYVVVDDRKGLITLG